MALVLGDQVVQTQVRQLGPGVAQHVQRARIGVEHAIAAVEQQDAVAELVEQVAPVLRHLLQVAVLAPAGQRLLGGARQILQVHQLLGAEFVHVRVGHAQRAQAVPVDLQRHADIGAQVRRLGDERVVCETRVLRRIGHDQRLVAHDRVGAEGHVARGLADLQADPRIEPLAVGIDQAQQRDREAADRRRTAHQAVDDGVAGGVEHAQRVQRTQTSGLVLRDR